MLLQTECVKQPLRGMLMLSIPGIDDGYPNLIRYEVRSTGRGTSHDHGIHAHGLDVQGGIKKRLTLGGTGGRSIEIKDVRTQSSSGQRETHASPRAVLEEECRDDSTSKVCSGRCFVSGNGQE